MRNFYIDGTSSATYNIYASGENVYNAAERNVESIPIPGRNGDLLIDNGTFKNIDVKYPCVIPFGFKDNASAIRSWLMSNAGGYHKITDDYDANHYRIGRYKGGIEFQPMYTNQAAALCDVTFDCKPQRFLTSGDSYISKIVTEPDTEVTLVNPTNFDAKPILYVQKQLANDTMVVTVNDKEFSILPSSGRTAFYIECESMNVYYGAENRNVYFVGDFPSLKPGENKISFTGSSGGSAYISIKPRWWEL